MLLEHDEFPMKTLEACLGLNTMELGMYFYIIYFNYRVEKTNGKELNTIL